jgi:hypothetical protein
MGRVGALSAFDKFRATTTDVAPRMAVKSTLEG